MAFSFNYVKIGAGLALFVGAKVWLALDAKAKDEALTANAHNYVAFTAAQKTACETDLGLTNAECHCLYKRALAYSTPATVAKMPTFQGNWSMTGFEIMAIPDEALNEALYRADFTSNIYNMMDAEGEDMTSAEERELLDSLADILRLRVVENTSGNCLSEEKTTRIGTRGDDMYSYQRYMSQQFMVHERREELIAEGKISPDAPVQRAASQPSADTPAPVVTKKETSPQETASKGGLRKAPSARGLRPASGG